MSRIPFREVLEVTLGNAGQIVDSTAAAALSMAQNYINRRYEEALYFGPWPELMLDEERAFADDWVAERAWVTGEYCWMPPGIEETGKYYLALQDSTGKEPATEPTLWVEASPPEMLVATEQYGKHRLGRVFGAGCRPMRYRNAREFPFIPTAEGIVLAMESGHRLTCWIRYIPEAERWSTKVYSATELNYLRGDVVLSSWTESTNAMPARGECYRAEIDAGNHQFWMLQTFPRALAAYVEDAAGADLLRYYGKPEEADKLEAAADARLVNDARREGCGGMKLEYRI